MHNAHDDRIVARRHRFLRNQPAWKSGLLLELEPGRFRKRHPFDCGRSCLLCHWSKKLHPKERRNESKRIVRQERMAYGDNR